MANLQKKYFKDSDGTTVSIRNILTSSVKNPHQTFITINLDDKWYTRYVARYIDLDTIDTFRDVWLFLDSIKDEMSDEQFLAEMIQNNKAHKNFIKEDIEEKGIVAA